MIGPGLPFAAGAAASLVRNEKVHGTPVSALLDAIRLTFAAAEVPDARAEARDLVAAVLGQSRFWPLLEPRALIGAEETARACAAARRRAAGAPFAYAVGFAAFRHLTLRVDERVLIPRQETELIVDLVLAATPHLREASVADVGTGSGAIALALALEGGDRFGRVIATEMAAGALDVARANAAAVGAPSFVEFRHGSAMAPLRGELLDVLVANPPYIAFDEVGALPASVRDWEPIHALACGDGGLAVTREIVRGAPAALRPGGYVALECDSRRARHVAGLVAATRAFGDVTVHADLSGRERFVLARRT